MACAAGLALAACSVTVTENAPTPAAAPPQTDTTRAVVAAFMDLFCTQGKVREAFMTHVVPEYIQHNPLAADGRDNAINALEAFRAAQPQQTCEIKRLIADGNLAAIHTHIKMNPEDRGAAVVDILRVENGMIVEHWDVIQAIPATSANPHPMF
jgi:predicted SnoaL-like aldol condensation-catalyzing enzyme